MTISPDRAATSCVRYLCDARHNAEAARRIAQAQGSDEIHWLSQRGSRLGWLGEQRRTDLPEPAVARAAWETAQPVFLPDLATAVLTAQRDHIDQAHALMTAILNGGDAEMLLMRAPYATRLAPGFELLAASHNEGDPQEIVKLEFDGMENGEIVAENLWMKISWLSYEEHDASMRFRFSFGMENDEDVAADPRRQAYAAALTEAIFPESAVLSANPRLAAFLRAMLSTEDLAYVERIVYFNAPEGGAQFHHDVERGHLGVVFAQLSGRSAWLALSTAQLLDEIQAFLAQADSEGSLSEIIDDAASRTRLLALAGDRGALAAYLNDRDNDPLEQLINRTPAFARRLFEHGHGYILHPGDVLLLPQHDTAHCTWHAVYCLDDQPGEALSFAVRHA